MGRSKSRQSWQTVLFVVVTTAIITGLLYVFHENRLIQGVIIVVGGGVVSLRAFEEKTRRERLAQLFLGPFVASTALATIVNLNAALIPAVAFGALSLYYVASDAIRKDAHGHDSTGNA
jgi:tryptophan-rich sensory protein